MAKTSAGVLLFRRTPELEFFLVHPGGPFWARKDIGAWSLPKGEVDPGEELLDAARREFKEETSFTVDPPFFPLGTCRLGSGKVIHAWAAEGDADPSQLKSITFTLEYPPRSGRMMEFPEVDRAAWFRLDEALQRIHPGQQPFIRRCAELAGKQD